ncbi:dopamine N-acetyltransferase-like [Melanaphis sacchari]|uniref:dopamine N-acetyltransferase-like n=1 Tax=Melanaphis sacchari TaxID=742174 RepID=UPI000DC13DA6|nr:dopamine N-acetyltransferase-like [Melanaphis sacchari]XP_025199059.1 dopamine N-acetyltransferase-like [Melanaphis sacchari]XP_025199060.1 dopamine N-acetyltransferase-like [Melanaphis sacchari]XP_025199062.1 dopamine N-acetyltransferase-like [Melanaphis sacchari]XP_025199063.1 dopamine N-acetyltransferase-like [Melanaphis sacchari]
MNKFDVNKQRFSYNIVPMSSNDENDRQRVIEFIKKFFFQREPLVMCKQLEFESMEKLQNHLFRTLDNGLTFKAVSSDGDLIGFISNEIIDRENKKPSNCSSKIDDQENSFKFKEFMTLFQKIEQESAMFERYPDVNRVMDIKAVAVNETFKGQGVCKALFYKSKELALENKCSMVRVDCSSYFSASAAEKLGFQCIYSMNYEEYKNEKGEVIFDPLPPHKQFKVYVISIEKFFHSDK